MKWAIDRAREPSTMAGAAALAVALGANPEIINPIAQAVVAVAGLLAVLLKEGAAK